MWGREGGSVQSGIIPGNIGRGGTSAIGGKRIGTAVSTCICFVIHLNKYVFLHSLTCIIYIDNQKPVELSFSVLSIVLYHIKLHLICVIIDGNIGHSPFIASNIFITDEIWLSLY